MKASQLKGRTRRFAAAVLKLTEKLPSSVAGRAVARPMARCAAAMGSTYRATCRSHSTFDFIARIGAAHEAADECCYWFDLAMETQLLNPELVQPLLEECRSLRRIFGKSRLAAVRRERHEEQQQEGPSAADEGELPF